MGYVCTVSMCVFYNVRKCVCLYTWWRLVHTLVTFGVLFASYEGHVLGSMTLSLCQGALLSGQRPTHPIIISSILSSDLYKKLVLSVVVT